MKNEFEGHNVVYNLLTTSPVLGTSFKFLFDYTSMGISQYGFIWGLLRGGLVGVVMFFLMLTLTLVLPLGWEIIHYYFQMHSVEWVKAEIRSNAIDERPDNEHPGIKHYHSRFELPLGWLDPGRYILEEHGKDDDDKEAGR